MSGLPQKGWRSTKPFWLPASSYYVLSAAVSIAFFLLLWGLLYDGRDEMPWFGAALGAGLLFCGAVFLREIILRSVRERFLASQRRLDRTLKGISVSGFHVNYPQKITLESNASMLRELKRKSDAAKVLGQLADGHKRVFEECEEYISVIEEELPRVSAGSPRVAALRRGSEAAGKLHRFHLMKWTEIETRELTRRAIAHPDPSAQLEILQQALNIVETALGHYPFEPALQESQAVLVEMTDSVSAKQLIKQAEVISKEGKVDAAKKLYEEALYILSRNASINDGRANLLHTVTERLESLLARTSSISGTSKENG